MLKVSFNNLFYSVLVFNNQLNKLIHSSISIKVETSSLQWSDFRKKVGNPAKCPILVRIWSDLKVFRGIWRNLVEILRFIYMIMYFICISTLNIAVF